MLYSNWQGPKASGQEQKNGVVGSAGRKMTCCFSINVSMGSSRMVMASRKAARRSSNHSVRSPSARVSPGVITSVVCRRMRRKEWACRNPSQNMLRGSCRRNDSRMRQGWLTEQ